MKSSQSFNFSASLRLAGAPSSISFDLV